MNSMTNELRKTPNAPRPLLAAPILSLWCDTIEPAVPTTTNISQQVLASFYRHFKTTGMKSKKYDDRFKQGNQWCLMLTKLQEIVHDAWVLTAEEHHLDETLADAWFDWPALVQKLADEITQQEKEKWDYFNAHF
jgi:hypothetical protein